METRITSFTQLHTWQNARLLAVKIYKLTYKFPPEEKFGLTTQIRRSAVSVAANIAEGFSRQTAKDKKHFYTISLGSLTETLSHIYIAQDLGFIATEELEALEDECSELHKMINGLIKTAQDHHRNT